MEYGKAHDWQNVDLLQTAWLTTNRWNSLVQRIMKGECSEWEDV